MGSFDACEMQAYSKIWITARKIRANNEQMRTGNIWRNMQTRPLLVSNFDFNLFYWEILT